MARGDTPPDSSAPSHGAEQTAEGRDEVDRLQAPADRRRLTFSGARAAAAAAPAGGGPVIAIGGNEEESGRCDVLAAVAAYAASGPLAVLSAASDVPDRRWASYSRTFARLGVRELRHVDVRRRDDAFDVDVLAALDGAAVVFMTGGDQFRLLERVAGTPVHERMAELHAAGAAIAGTSAGAAACGETVIGWCASARGGAGARRTVRGLGFLPGVIVEQHCAQRGRVPRLTWAVCRRRATPAVGLGVDENTAVLLDEAGRLRVIGSGNVYVVRGEPGSAARAASDDAPPARRPRIACIDVLAAGDERSLDRRPGAVAVRRASRRRRMS